MRLALAMLAAGLLASGALRAQSPSPAPAPDCPQASQTSQRHLLGVWRAQFEEGARGATLLLEQHPELSESVRGEIIRDGERAWLAGDIDDGDFSLEESANGVNISAVWIGEVVEGSCGREIRGAWKAEGDPRQLQFVLRKQPAP
jgi:hypothetical protein